MEKLTSIWQIDEIMVENIKTISGKYKRYRDEETNQIKSRYLTYEEKLHILLEQYNELLKRFTHRDDGISLWAENDIKAYVNDKLKLTLKWLFYYYKIGNLIESNKCANRLFRVTANHLSAQALFPTITIKNNTYWFRARKPDNTRYNRRNIFHIPFENREFVGTNRFSIPGYPCLYLASSMLAAKEETGNLGITAISCFKNIKDIDAYDFTFFPHRGKEDWQSLYKDIMTYPFKIAVSIPTNNKDEGKEDGPFKEEYIIPQLLLHCVVRQAGVKKLALLYSSTKSIQDGIPKQDFQKHINLVHPTVSIREKGYCGYLVNQFILTNPQIVPFSYLDNSQIEDIENKMKNDEMRDLNDEKTIIQ